MKLVIGFDKIEGKIVNYVSSLNKKRASLSLVLAILTPTGFATNRDALQSDLSWARQTELVLRTGIKINPELD